MCQAAPVSFEPIRVGFEQNEWRSYLEIASIPRAPVTSPPNTRLKSESR